MDSKRHTGHAWAGITYEELTPPQKEFLLAVLQNPRKSFLLRGCAGSGKTVLAGHALAILNQKGAVSAGLLAYTKLLAKFIRDGFPNGGAMPEVTHYHHWKNDTLRYRDLMLVDECQDFPADWIADVRSNSAAQIWLGDENQQLYCDNTNNGEGIAGLQREFPEGTSVYLDTNYRNSPFVARFASRFIRLTPAEEAAGVTLQGKIDAFMKPILRNTAKTARAQNQPVVLIEAADSSRELDALASVIKDIYGNPNLSSKKIAIAHFSHKTLDVLQEELVRRGISPFRITRDKNSLPEFSQQFTLLSPMHSLKGLEFDYVFFPWSDLDGWSSQDTLYNLLFVLFTRARSRVYCGFSSRKNSCVYGAVAADEKAGYYTIVPADSIVKNGNPETSAAEVSGIIKRHFDEFNL